MKHEALTEAISMLDDELIAEAQEPFRKRRIAPVIRLCAAAAACAAAVGAFLLIPRGSGADILIMGEDPAGSPVAIRTENNEEIGVIRAFALEYTEIPVSIVSAEKTVVSVSGGELYITGEGEEKVPAASPLELDGNASLVWSVPLWDAGAELELTVRTGADCRVFMLSFDESAQEWTIRENTPHAANDQ